MNKQLLFTLVLIFSFLNINAQFTGDFENYTDGEPICSFDSNAAWQAWCTPLGEGCCMMATSDQAHSGIISGEIPGDGTTSAILNLGGMIFGGVWCLEFYMYVPSSKEASFSIQGEVPPVGSGQSIVGNIYFNKDIANPGVGFIDWDTASTTDDTYFDFPHNEWFPIRIGVDLSLGVSSALWGFFVNYAPVVLDGSPFTNGNGVYPTSLGGINFPSSGVNTQYYLDDFSYSLSNYYNCYYYVSVEENNIEEFNIYPNPANNYFIINNSTDVEIENINIFNLLGSLMIEVQKNYNKIDIKKLKPGTYILKIETKKGTVSKKVVKI